MECGCSIDSYSDDYSNAFHTTSMRKARKEHVCGECGRKIARGESYERSAGLFDGKILTDKTCPDCLSLREEFFCSWIYSTLWNDFECEVRENHEYISYAALANLTPAARAKACEIIEQVWSDEDDEPEEA